MARKRPTPNPNGREGDPLKIDLPFDEAIRATLEVKHRPAAGEPPPRKPKRKKKTTS